MAVGPSVRLAMTTNQSLEQAVIGLLLSGFMSLVVTGISAAKCLGLGHIINALFQFFEVWMASYASSWLVAFPVVLLVAPTVHRIVPWLFSQRA
jgi:hypothetical protein